MAVSFRRGRRVRTGVFVELRRAVQGVAPDAPRRGSSAGGAEVTAAEAAIAGSDWKTAEAKLDPWLVSHPEDARALFDAGYVADAQNRLDDAAGALPPRHNRQSKIL